MKGGLSYDKQLDYCFNRFAEGRLSKNDAEELLVNVADEMIDASDECTGTLRVSITDHEHELFIRILKGLVAGG